MITILIILCILFDIGYLYSKSVDKNKIALVSKTLAALCFIIIGFNSLKENESSFALGICIGLVFDGIGDLLLALRNINNKKHWFILGGLSFLLGHFLYIGSLIDVGLETKNDLLFIFVISGLLIGLVALYILTRICRINKAYLILGFIYSPSIFAVLTTSIYVYISYTNITDLIFLIGALLFVSSDMILIINNFGIKRKWMHPVYSLLYFVGQILIAYSLNI